MEIFALIMLGLLQGLTEFLPVSSSGHLVLFGNLFGVEENSFCVNTFALRNPFFSCCCA